MEKTVVLQPNAFLVNVDAKSYSNCDIVGSFYTVYEKKDVIEKELINRDELIGKPKESGK